MLLEIWQYTLRHAGLLTSPLAAAVLYPNTTFVNYHNLEDLRNGLRSSLEISLGGE